MFDWIVVSELVIHFFWGCFSGSILGFMGLAIFFRLTGKDEDDVKPRFVFLWLFIVFSMGIGTAFSHLPESIIKANIARVKIHDTSPQSIAKIESGALEVVNKLDKLIDKGINRLERDNDKQ